MQTGGKDELFAFMHSADNEKLDALRDFFFEEQKNTSKLPDAVMIVPNNIVGHVFVLRHGDAETWKLRCGACRKSQSTQLPRPPTTVNCRDGISCRHVTCRYEHPSDWEPQRLYKCKFGAKCYKSDCKYSH